MPGPESSKSATTRHLHSSFPSQLWTELAVLRLLHRRSGPQHRSAIFMRHVAGVLRLGRRTAILTSEVSKQTVPTTSGKLNQIAQKLITALFSAANATNQLILMRHFVPLQTLLLSIYARLFSLMTHLVHILGADALPTDKPETQPELERSDHHPDLVGEKVAREPIPAAEQKPQPSTQMTPANPPSNSTPILLISNFTKQKAMPTKKKKSSAIDDIFGL